MAQIGWTVIYERALRAVAKVPDKTIMAGVLDWCRRNCKLMARPSQNEGRSPVPCISRDSEQLEAGT